MITLTPLKKFKYPVYAECINPDVFQGKDTTEIANLALCEGNQSKKLSDLFKIEEDNAATPNITINGDVSEVRRIGAGMKTGEIVINGNVGMHLGEKMAGESAIERESAFAPEVDRRPECGALFHQFDAEQSGGQ